MTTPKNTGSGGGKSELIMGAAIIALIFAALMTWVGWSIRTKQAELNEQIQARLELLARGRAEVFTSWLSGLEQQSERLISSDLFRLYATDMDLIDADPGFLITGAIPEGREHDQMAQLADQFPLMHRTFADFTSFAGFLSGRIVHRSGQSYIGSGSRLQPLSPQQAASVRKTFAAPMTHFSSLRQEDTGLVLDMFVPIISTAQDEKDEKKAAAVVMLTKSANTAVTSVLSNTPLSASGERTRIMQTAGTGFQEIVPWQPGGTTPLVMPLPLNDAKELPFARRGGANGEVYSLGVKLPDMDIWIVQEVDAREATRTLHQYARVSVLIATLIALAISLLFGLIWWRTMGRKHRDTAERFRTLAQELEKQRNFLDSINDTIPDFIAVKNLDGAYTYANPALAEGVGRTEEEIHGMDDVALFGFDTGKRLEQSDEKALKTGGPVTATERIYLKSQLHHFQITKVPLRNDQGEPEGVIAVFRDITSMIQAEERKRQAVFQTVEALVKAIEFTDPYLAGHSALMREVSSLLADSLHMSAEEKSTVEIASNLSQIGKIFVDKAVLTKAGQLSDMEKELIRKHVEHAAEILRQINFDLPVFEAVVQMNERLDGSGYPKGLHGEEIGLHARVLSVANSFCAMIRPRAYRPAMTVEQALENLRASETSYDRRIVDALRAAMGTVQGDRVLQKTRE